MAGVGERKYLVDHVVLADLKGDGKLDLATANVVSSDVSVLFDSGTGALAHNLIRDERGAVAYASAATPVN